MAGVAIINVKKSYGAVQVLHGVDLSVRDGEFLVLVGPSGCGKSTLLRMIAGLEDITQGDVQIGDTIVTDLLPKDRDIAMVFQNYALYPHMRVRDNMAFSLKLSRRSRAEIDRMVEHAAGILDLAPLLDRFPRELSGGQRQRVAMGRAIVRDPALFLFDEPLSNLDAQLRVQMRGEIKALHQRLKSTMIYVTHDQIEAMTMADRIVVMRGGHVEQVGTPLEVYDQPSNVFVAKFIGSPAMNMVEGAVKRGKNGMLLRTQDNVQWPLPSDLEVRENENLVLGVRPEHLKITDEGIAANVLVVEPTGSETHVVLDVGAQHITVASRDRISLMPGSPVALTPDMGHMHVFDETGRRIGG